MILSIDQDFVVGYCIVAAIALVVYLVVVECPIRGNRFRVHVARVLISHMQALHLHDEY